MADAARTLAERAAAEAARELGLDRVPEVRFVRGRDRGRVKPTKRPGSIYVNPDQSPAEIIRTARHETYHVAQTAHGLPVSHDGFDRLETWRRSSAERFATGELSPRKARRRLAREQALRTTTIRIILDTQEDPCRYP